MYKGTGKEKIMKKRSKYLVTAAAMAVMIAQSAAMAGAAGPGSSGPGSTTTTTTTTTNTTGQTGWVQAQDGRDIIWYYYENGKMLQSQWKLTNAGLWYYLDDDGIMMTGWGEDDAEGYYFEESGAMATGWREITAESSTGPGGTTSEKGWYYFGTGKMHTGWAKLGDKWYYLNDGEVDDFEEGQMVYGEVKIEGDDYYFGTSADGTMKTGMVKVVKEADNSKPGGSSTATTYSFYGDDGKRVTSGWAKNDKKWCYIDEEGLVVTGQLLLDSDNYEVEDIENAYYIYYMDENGYMKTGWIEEGQTTEVRPGVTKEKTRYYYTEDGMQLGWTKLNSKWYYFAPERDTTYSKGECVTGLHIIDNNTYYFNTDGTMAVSTWKEVTANGSERDIYLGSDGVMYKANAGESFLVVKISSKYYVFTENGYLVKNTTIYDVDGAWTTQAPTKSGSYKSYSINKSGVATSKTYKVN